MKMTADSPHDAPACIVCVHAGNSSASVNVDERTPLVSSKSSANSGSDRQEVQREHYDINRRQRPNRFSWLLVTVLALFFSAGIGIATYLLFNEGSDFVPEICTLVGREEWKASPSAGPLFAVSVPADGVVLADTHSARCDGLPTCARLISRLQNESMAQQGLPDLRYNFLVDDFGTVYEGLGWYHTLAEDDPPMVALIGDYAGDAPTHEQFVALQILLKFAVDRSVLAPCYALIVAQDDADKLSLRSLATMLQVEARNECI